MPVRTRGALILLAALLLCGGCRRSPAPTETPAAPAPANTLKDDLDRPWEGPLPARRVISLAPNVTEIVCALGCRDRLVGIDTASDYPPEATKTERVGDFLRPSVERIVALRADVLLLSSAQITPAAAAELPGRFRTPVFVLNPQRIADVTANVRVIARLLGVEARGEELSREMEARFAAVESAVAGKPRRKVFFEVWHEPLTTAGAGTFVDDLIRLAGGSNVAASQPKQFPTYSLEALLGADPDVYIVTTMQEQLLTTLPDRRPGFGSLRAVRQHRVRQVPADPVLRPTPRLAEGSEQLARAIHPEAFGAKAEGASPSPSSKGSQ